MTGRPRAALLLIITILITASPLATAQAQSRDQLQGPTITAHEWGVWKLRAGQVVHLEELAAEVPGFVFRAPPLPARPIRPPMVLPGPNIRPVPGPPIPVRPPHPPVARKPVIFLRTDRQTPITVEVGFNGGEPWLYYPAAEAGISPQGIKTLSWSGQLVPSGRAPLAPVEGDHFWNDLRQAGGHLLLGRDGTAEQFIFYDGPVRFERPFNISRQGSGARITPLSSEHRVWLTSPGHFVEARLGEGDDGVVINRGVMTELRAQLDTELQQRGLTPAESRSLLETWRDELFEPTGSRAVYFMPRPLYDRMLPIRISPAPTELVRVGLVIEELD